MLNVLEYTFDSECNMYVSCRKQSSRRVISRGADINFKMEQRPKLLKINLLLGSSISAPRVLFPPWIGGDELAVDP